MLPILPTAPSRTDPVNFSAEADAWVAALPAWTDAVNAIEGSLQASTLIGTSTTSLSVGTGSKGFTSQSGKAWLVGAYLFIVATSDNTKVMQGKVTSYNSSTGSLVVDVNLASGSGTYSSWDIGVANPAIGYNNSATIAGTVTSQHPTDPACITNVNGTNALYMHSTSGASEINELRALPLLFAVNGAERMRIDASGNVGINAPAAASKLTVKQPATSNGITLEASADASRLQTYTDGTVWAVDATVGGSGSYQPITFKTNGSERMRIDTSGNVGIGTDSPNRPITINNTNAQIQFVNSNTGTAATDGLLVGMGGASSSDAYINQLENANLIFNTNGTERARFTSTGLFGIGGTPTTKLEVFGSTGNIQFSTTGNKITFTRNGANYIACAGASGSVNYAAATHSFYNEAETVERLRIDINSNILSVANGGIGYGAGSGGSVTQATSKSTGVTLDKVSGQITMNAAALAANTSVFFLVTNSAITATDNVVVNLKGGYATYGTYDVKAEGIAAGSFVITLRNISAGSLSEAVVLSFAIIRGSTT